MVMVIGKLKNCKTWETVAQLANVQLLIEQMLDATHKLLIKVLQGSHLRNDI